MLDARDVVRASHCDAGLLSGLFGSPFDSLPIIALSRETIVDTVWSKLEPHAYAHPHTQILLWPR